MEVGRLQPVRQGPFLRHAHRHQRQAVTSLGGTRPSTLSVRARPLERLVSMGQIAIALYHSRARPQPREGKGVGIYCQHRSRRPALRIAGCPIQPTTLTIKGRKTTGI